ncbi:hypothetical protein D1BOALGB6SA_4222 [Olavius sp. associated proteobacterium Delta 1]|nr:hypothetical protein D1BOALGB6SA_4222 [Olavius sp. associated proteobacterium Delta 1]
MSAALTLKKHESDYFANFEYDIQTKRSVEYYYGERYHLVL